MIDESTKPDIWQSKNDGINTVTAFYQDPVGKQAFSLQGEQTSKQYKILIKQTCSNYRLCKAIPISVKKTTKQQPQPKPKE